MNYSKLQKIISSFLLFIFFFGQIFGLSFFSLFSNTAYAQNKEFHDVVSIIVNKEIYDELDSEIERYAQDIQNYLNNTRVVILPIKKDTTAFQIASMNEKLFYEGYKGLRSGVNFESKLIGTIIIGKIDLPIIEDNGKTLKSILPFTDFEDKQFIYNSKTRLFEKNSNNINGVKPEIFHGIISPNTGNEQENINNIKKFLDKDHDFYEGKNIFDSKKDILNGKEGEKVNTNYEPYVFYFDGIREQKALSYTKYLGYESYLENKEDLVYHRYSQNLNKKIQDKLNGGISGEVDGLLKKIDNKEILNAYSNNRNINTIGASDISLKYIIDGSINKFLEIFNKGTISDFRTNVHNAGRYNVGSSKVNIDMIPYLISVLDESTSKIIKSSNTEGEKSIDNLVKDFLSRDIAIPTKVEVNSYNNLNIINNKDLYSCNNEYLNFFNGKQASNINNASECSIYRGGITNGGTLVEANRGLNIDLIQSDVKLCDGKNPKGYYSGASFLNVDISKEGSFNLKSNDKTRAIRPLFDLKGSTKINDNSKIPSPLNCFDNNFLVSVERNYFWDDIGNNCNAGYVLPIDENKGVISGGNQWSCSSENKKYNIDINYEEEYKKEHDIDKVGNCGQEIFSEMDNSKLVFNEFSTYYNNVATDYDGITHNQSCLKKAFLRRISFKKISSYVEHKSPTVNEFNDELKSKITKNLPIDKDRYIDFISAKGNYIKINYPYFFRVAGVTVDEVKNNLDKYLDQKNIEINKIITSENPDSLNGKDKEIYEILKRGEYITDKFDIKKIFQNKNDYNISLGGEEKKFNYYDFLVFSILWNNLDNISAKYKFIMQNYLSDQIGGNDLKFILPKNKKQYEIAYLGANGDAQNMYIQMNPNKDNNPYNDIFSKNALLNSHKISIGVLNGTNKIDYNVGNINNLPSINYEDGLFKCAPPEGVPIWKWLPAVKCWLDGLFPLKVGAGECSFSTIFGSDDEKDYYELLNEQNESGGKSDNNRNGISDVCENSIINNGKLKLYSDFSRYSFKNVGFLKTEVLDKDGKRIMIDNSSKITFSVKKIIDKNTGKIVFDSSVDNFKNKKGIISKYISFNEIETKSVYGASKYSFATKNKQADVYFEANLDLRDYKNKSIKKIKSNTLILKIRNENLFILPKIVSHDNKIKSGSEIRASDKVNIYLYDEKNTKLNTNNLNKNSLVLGIENIGNNGKNAAINFPISIKLIDSKQKVIIKEKLNTLSQIKSLAAIKKSGRYKLIIEDKYGYNADINIDILSEIPSKLKLDLGSNILQNSGSVSTNLVSIYDKFDNIVAGDKYSFKLNILGDSIEFNDNNSKKLSLSTILGYKAFRIKSTKKEGISKLKIDLYSGSKKLLSSSKNIQVLDTLKANIKFNNTLKVGNNKYSAELVFIDKNNNLISNLNSRIYLNIGGEYLKFSKSYYDIINGKAEINFETKTLAGKNIPITFRIEGFSKTINKNIDILPGKAFGLTFVNTKTELEANNNEGFINIELRDIYNNVVFTDSESIISTDIKGSYKNIINIESTNKKLFKGKTSFKIKTTDNPGKAYIKFSINKKLEDNKFIIGEKNKKITISGVSENFLKIETYFFYNKKSIEGRKYNSMYTTLLGAEYGDITQKDYLAGAMLFDKDNRSLAVTSLLNSPYNKLDSLIISSEGIISKSYDSSDLTQDVSISLRKDLNNVYYLGLFNSALNKNIGKIYLNFDNLNINEKIINEISNSKVIDIKKLFDVKNIAIYSASNKIKLNSLIKDKNNSLIIYIEGTDYNIRDLYSISGKSRSIYYIDPFSTKTSLNSFSKYTLYSYDNFIKNKKVGWEAGNKTLLAFASGESVGKSTQDYMGISGINLGDPIISLKKIQKKSYGVTKNFDSTIGKKLNNKDIKTYRTFDYNNDNLEDIIIVENGGLLSLLENTKTVKGFLNQKHLARITDIGKADLISTGDFSGDGYDDIFFVNKKGEPFLLDNNKKDFTRYDLRENFSLRGKIIQAKSFDMDNDGYDDIVTLDDFGEINIFYGKKDTKDFSKKTIYSGYGMKLNSGIRNNLGAIYFDGLTQEVRNKKNITDSTKFRNVDLLENLMFENITYDPYVDPEKQNFTKNTKFIKSEFASQVGLKIEKTYKDINGGNLVTGDIIEVEVKIKNITSGNLNNIVYAENYPKFFELINNSVKTDKNTNIKRNLGYYKFYIDKFKLNSGSELILKYNLKTKALSYGNIKVGLFEKDEVGDDKYGDIIVSSTKYNCGGDNDIFRSIDKRKYLKGLKIQSCDDSSLPEDLEKNNLDKNNNGIPDYLDKIISESNSNSVDLMKEYSKNTLNNYVNSEEISIEENIYEGIDKVNEKVDNISDDIDNLVDGFGCGFGGGSCFSSPINWAPLAPGNDISTPFGLVGDGLKVGEGMPVFSALTGLQMMCGHSPCCIPTVWPVSSLAYVPGPACGSPSAGGYLGTWAPTNKFRLFITPTLSGGVGTAACFGGPASAAGQIPPKAVTPFITGGNCVVSAAPLQNLCKDEEINGDPASVGEVEYIGGGNGEGLNIENGNGEYGVINANCNSSGKNNKPLPISNKIDTSLASEYLKYRNTGVQSNLLIKSIDEQFKNINNRQIDYNSGLLHNEPLISIGGTDIEDSDFSVGFDVGENGNTLNFNAVEELKMERIAPFPKFITQWVNDQLEEFITKLVDFPTLFIILPDFSKLFDSDWGEYINNLVKTTKNKYQTSGIKEAYEFLGNVPFVSIDGETININIPEIDPETIESIITQRKMVLESYPRQIEEAEKSGEYSPQSIISAREFVKSLKINLQILETYKDIPGAISKLFNKKQDYLEQIMCNIETIENITGGWININGKRFKAWVELYILIKAILKSWQVLVDIFQDYDESCHECKNERWDSTQWEWSLIKMIIPPIPVVQFPKWPDIVLDIHNIRLNLTIKLPEFKINSRPIILPPAPLLLLPEYNFILPKIPRLPLLEIPELPDLPSLPTVQLPNLPPPPTLPKLWSNIESFLNVLKLIVKAMCILKKLPLVPEHRAGDQIAFLTEGGGYRGFDFMDKLLPNFSYPYLDEIKVTSWINLETETDFVTEMARTIVSPINDFTNDFTHLLDGKGIDNVDLSKYSKSVYNGENVDSTKFIALLNKELLKKSLISNPNFNKLKKSFDTVNNYTYSKENNIINNLSKIHYEKFDILKSIIKKEIKDNKKLKSKNIFNTKKLYRTIANNDIDKIKVYNSSLKKYNEAFKKSVKKLLNPQYFDTKSIQDSGKKILKDLKNTTDNYNKFITNKYNKSFNIDKKKQYLASVDTNATNGEGESCKTKNNSKYKRKYKGLYIIQGKINYKLFDYLDELDGNEITTAIDYDLDGDKDLLYQVGTDLYLKENLFNKKVKKNHFSGVDVLDIDDNKFINGEIAYEAVNGLNESYVSNNLINVNFVASNRENINNYRFEYYSIIDKYLNENNSLYIPEKITKNMVDSFAGIDDITKIESSKGFTIRKNLAYISEVGNNISKVKLKTKKLLNIKDSLKNGNIAIIPGNTQIYAGGSRASITYIIGGNKESKTIDSFTNISFDSSINIVKISGDLYVKGDKDIILQGNEIYFYLNLPIFDKTKIFISSDFYKTSSSYIGIKYYDQTEVNLDFRKINSYLIYDLGIKSDNYSINLKVSNDYYYSRISLFKNNIFGTKTSQTLISPQLESDREAPELDISSSINIPVYQYKTIDLTDKLYENSGIDNISEFKIEGIGKDKYEILKVSNKYKIKFGKFDKIFSKQIKFVIRDKLGNTLKKDVDLVVYPPFPEINSYSGTIISGIINEKLTNEPINLYRFRGGILKRLETNSGKTRVQTDTGKFVFNANITKSNLIDVNIDNNKLFNVNEKTGIIKLLNIGYKIKATINNNNFIEINVLNNNNETVFSEIIKMNSKNQIKLVKNFTEIKEDGLYLRISDNDFDYYKIPDSVKFNSGSIVIYRKTDSNKEPLFVILKDSRIKTLNNFYKIEYSTFNNYIVIKLIDKHFNKKVGELLLKLNSSYIIK